MKHRERKLEKEKGGCETGRERDRGRKRKRYSIEMLEKIEKIREQDRQGQRKERFMKMR